MVGVSSQKQSGSYNLW